MAIVPDGAEFDFVIVGAGSAGCVLANRLSANPGVKVALLEAGSPDKGLLLRMPAGSGSILPEKNAQNWGFESAPQPNLGGRSTYQPRGRGWGGSSSINGMIYIRGHARDYDHWRQLGLTGWGYRDVLPYFRRSENNDRFKDAYHGSEGPLAVTTPRETGDLYKAFVQAGVAAGYPETDDFNGPRQEGVGFYQMTIDDGVRCSASAAFLRPILAERGNLVVLSNARTHRVLLSGGRATGVEYSLGPGAAPKSLLAAREVILSAGTFQSPQLLMLSGIGPAGHLGKVGVPVAIESSEVGHNLQDHFDLGLVWDCTQPITVYSQTKGIRRALVGLRYMVDRGGSGRSNHIEAGGFLRTRKELDAPDVQLHFFDANFFDHARSRPQRDGFAVHVCQLRPESRGEVRLSSADPLADPVIDPNYLAAETDRRTMRESVRIVRKIVNQSPLDPFRGAEHRPGQNIETDAEIDEWVRATGETIYHPVGTCRMGADSRSVVDGELRVRGVAGLRVADASVMPSLVGGNTNAPAIMIAEKAADMILGHTPMAPEDVAVAGDALVQAM